MAFKFKIIDIEKDKLGIPKDGAYIHGLYFAGARWDSNKDTLADEKSGIINEQLPFLLLIPSENV